MTGIRINNTTLGQKATFESALGFKVLVDKTGEAEASAMILDLFGNALVQGSSDGVSWHYIIASTDTLFRISTNGGSTWTKVDLGLKNNLYLNNGVPYISIAEANSLISIPQRSPYLTVNINGTEYWYTTPSTLVDKFGSLSIPDNSVTMAKLANIDSGYVFYRASAGNGDPEAVPLATLKTALLLSNTNTGDETKASIEEKLLLTAPSTHFVQNNELVGYIPVTPGYGLISDSDLLRLQSTCSIYTITLPSASTVAGRIAAAVSGTNYPTGWVLSDNGVDISITHNLDRRIASVSIFSDNGTVERQLFGNAAFSGIFQNHTTTYNQLTIESLATIETTITIQLVFAGSTTPTVIVPQTIPTVETYTPSNITATSFDTGGTVTDDGNSAVTERGICWGFAGNPTILGYHQASGSGVGFFYNNIIGLDPNTVYFYRAYATNAVGTAYGININFTTHSS